MKTKVDALFAHKQPSAAQEVVAGMFGTTPEKVAENRAQQPSLGAELKAMAREAVKDIRGTIHETFFGSPEHPGELGTPLNPTPQLTTQDLLGHPVHRDTDVPNTVESLFGHRDRQQEQERTRGMDAPER